MGLTKLETFYANDAYKGFGNHFDADSYSEYVRFVKAHVGTAPVIEIGSGLGAAAYHLHSNGVAVTASDIFPDLATAKFRELGIGIKTLKLNVNNMELDSASADNFSMYQVLEHIQTPELALSECYRCLRPGGKLMLVSPNLLSPLSSLKAIVSGVSGRWQTPWFKRNDGYTFPVGDTITGQVMTLGRNLGLTVAKAGLKSQRRPLFREPCLKTPALSDSDAVFLTNPLDVRAILQKIGFEMLSFQKERATGIWAGSLWLAARKP